ncbi:unnamed protein product [Ixodes persulcatus]
MSLYHTHGEDKNDRASLSESRPPPRLAAIRNSLAACACHEMPSLKVGGSRKRREAPNTSLSFSSSQRLQSVVKVLSSERQENETGGWLSTHPVRHLCGHRLGARLRRPAFVLANRSLGHSRIR